jgi:hypothetical protein
LSEIQEWQFIAAEGVCCLAERLVGYGSEKVKEGLVQ